MAALLRAAFTGTGVRDFLKGKIKFGQRPFGGPVGKAIGKDVITSALEELSAQHTRLRGGGTKAFKPAIEFVNRRPGKTLRGAGGRFGQAWRGAKVTAPKGRTVRVEADLGPAGPVIMGGKGLTRKDTITRIKPKGNPGVMRFAVAQSTGTFFSLETIKAGVKWPSRPHGGWHPQLTAKVAKRVAEAAASA